MSAMQAGLVALGCAISAGAIADVPSQVDDYKWATGTWKCKGLASNPPHPFTATFTLTREMDGAAYLERWVEDRSAEHTQPFSVMYLWTYDPKAKLYVRTGVDGGANQVAASSPGWQNGVWTWEAQGFRIPVTRDGSRHFHLSAELQKDGAWVTLAEADCDK
jgi:hypothetical protein